MGGTQIRTEPNKTSIIQHNPEAMDILAWTSWLAFFEQFQSADSTITVEFSKSFNGQTTTIQCLTFSVNE